MDDQDRNGGPVPTRPGLDTQTIIDLLNKHADEHGENGVVTYAKLGEAVGRNTTDLRGLLMTARKNILRDKNDLWICVPGGGVKVATASESLDHAMQDQKSSGRKVDKSIGALGAVKVRDLHETEKVQYDTAGSMAHFLKAMHKPRSRNRIKQRIVDTGKTIDADAVLKLLADKD